MEANAEPLIENLPDEDVLRDRLKFHNQAVNHLRRLLKTVVKIRGCKPVRPVTQQQPVTAGVVCAAR